MKLCAGVEVGIEGAVHAVWRKMEERGVARVGRVHDTEKEVTEKIKEESRVLDGEDK